MKKLLTLALVAGGALAALYPPLAFLTVAFVIAAVVVLTLPDRAFSMSPDTTGDGHGHAPRMSVWGLSKNDWAAMTILFAVLSAVGHTAWRRIDEATSWLMAMVLAAMRGLADLVLMAWAVFTAWTTGSSGHQRVSSAALA